MVNDPIFYWNEVMLEVHRLDFSPPMLPDGSFAYGPDQGGPTRTSRGFAMVHLAMHDAWRTLRTGPSVTYLPGLPAPDLPASSEAAVCWAAAGVLTALWPTHAAFVIQKRDDFAAKLGGLPTSQNAQMIINGATFGAKVAAAMLAARANDGSADPGSYTVPPLPGMHRVDPYFPDQGFLTPAWGDVTLFGGPMPAFVGPLGKEGPGEFLQDPGWEDEVDEVRRLGADYGYKDCERTPEQTVIGIFWGYDGAFGLGTPPRLYNQCLRSISEKLVLAPDENAILFARANVAMADAGIAAWREKYIYNVWRPVIGVREAAASYGPVPQAAAPKTFADGALEMPVPASYQDVEDWLAVQPDSTTTTYGNGSMSDPTWKPLGAPRTNTPGAFHASPNFPAYPSGHATFGAACFGIVHEYLVEKCMPLDEIAKLCFTFVSDEFNGRSIDPDGSVRPRHVRELTLAQAIHENAIGRLYIGVHWRIDSVEGVRLGSEIARTRANLLASASTSSPAMAQP